MNIIIKDKSKKFKNQVNQITLSTICKEFKSQFETGIGVSTVKKITNQKDFWDHYLLIAYKKYIDDNREIKD
jgi:hypothetical protein